MSKPRILLVDDEADIVETIRFALDMEGYDVLTASNGLEGLEKARKELPDLILMDVMMPKENGYRVSQMIRQDEKEGKIAKRIPIILLTARNLEDDPEREKMFMNFSQADSVVYKPFEMDDLLKHVREILKP